MKAEYTQIYKNTVSNMSNFCPFRKEKQMDYLFNKLKDDFIKKNLQILDACCGYGRLIHFLNEFNQNQNYIGLDYTEKFIQEGQEKFKQHNNIQFECCDIFNISKKYTKYFDIAINYKTLSWLEYYDKIIPELIKVTKNKIYITSLFSDNDVEYIVKITQNSSSNPNYTHLNTYSFNKFKIFCLQNGAKEVNDTNMNLDFDLPILKKNSFGTHTVRTKEDAVLEVTGNIILNWKLVEIIL